MVGPARVDLGEVAILLWGGEVVQGMERILGLKVLCRKRWDTFRPGTNQDTTHKRHTHPHRKEGWRTSVHYEEEGGEEGEQQGYGRGEEAVSLWQRDQKRGRGYRVSCMEGGAELLSHWPWTAELGQEELWTRTHG